jgi:phage shock protein C
MARRRLTRSRDQKMIAGVCGGLAEYYGISVTRIRLAFVIFGIFGAGEIVYLVLWLLLPRA